MVGACGKWLKSRPDVEMWYDIRWLQTVKARFKSLDALAALRATTSGLSPQQQDTALKRLLGQSWQV